MNANVLSLDILTLGVTLAIVSMMSVVVLFTFWRINVALPGALHWTLGGFAFSLAYLSGFVAAWMGVPGGWGPTFSNSLSMAGMVLSIEGCLRFRGSVSATRWRLMLALLPVLAAWFLFTRETPLARLLVHDALAFVGLSTMALIMLSAGGGPGQRRVNMLAGLSAALLALGFLSRWIYALNVPANFQLAVVPINAPLFLCIIVFNIGWTYGLGAACYYRSNRQVMSLAREDALTGLPNRRSIDERLAAALRAGRRRDDKLALVMLDLNGFKQVNDLHGHRVGDRLLIALAERLAAAVRESDFAGRLGGDEFLVIATGLSTPEQGQDFVARLRDALQAEVRINDQIHRMSISMGLAVWPEDGDTVDDLLRVADQRMYQDKERNHQRGAFDGSDVVPALS